MILSLADRLALIYTSAGSMRKVAAFTGLSHQQVGRILRNAESAKSNAHYESRADIVAGVDTAFDIHSQVTREQARIDQIPFSKDIPVFNERLPLRHQAVMFGDKLLFKGEPELVTKYLQGKTIIFETVDQRTGEITQRKYTIDPQYKGRAKRTILLGERVGALHTHWLSNRVRSAWIVKQQKSGKFYGVSVGSLVNLKKYNVQSNRRAQIKIQDGTRRTKQQIINREQIKKRIKESDADAVSRVYTPTTALDPQGISALVVADIESNLRIRHEPATGDPGTRVGDQILLQLDTRKNQQHAKPRKTRGNKPRN